MAMTECKECKKPVSSRATTCPHCGIKNPAIKFKEMVPAIILIAGIGWAVVSFRGDDAKSAAATESSESTTPPTKTPEQIAVDLEACKSDLTCWGNKNLGEAGIQCDEHIEKLSAYSFEWTNGWLDQKFSKFRWLDQSNGDITYTGDKLRFQNGYGAWSNMIYECDFNPDSRVVLAVRAATGRI